MTPIDLTSKSPAEYRVRLRDPSSITQIVVHQMGCAGSWRPDSSMWAKVRAHYVCRFDGSVLMNHRPEVRMRYGCGVANRYSINIEHQGNYPSDKGAWYMGDKYGRDEVLAHPEMVRASRELIRSLVAAYPSIRRIVPHRVLTANRANCCGPDLWTEVGEWAVRELGLRCDHAPIMGGLPIPDMWRGAPSDMTREGNG